MVRKFPYFAQLLDNTGRVSEVWKNYFLDLMEQIRSGLVNRVRGTSGRILVTGTQAEPIINIDPAYVASAAQGGTGQSSYTLGDTLYSPSANALTRLPGATAAARHILSQTGTGAASAAPAWQTAVSAQASIPGRLIRGTTAGDIAAVGGQIILVDGDDLAAVVAALGSTPAQVVVAGQMEITANLTIPDTISISAPKCALPNFSISTGVTLTMPRPEADLYQIFEGSGLVTLTTGGTIPPQWWGTGGGLDVMDDALAFMAAISCVQRSAAITTVQPEGKYFVRQPIVFSRPAAGDYRFEIRGDGQRKAWIEVSSTVSTGSPIAAVLQFNGSGGNMEDLTFERFHIVCNSRANYGIDCGTNVGVRYTPEASWKTLRISGALLAPIRSSTWVPALDGLTLRGNPGDGIVFSGDENNAVNMIRVGTFGNDGLGINYKGGNALNTFGGVIEEDQLGGVFIGGPARAVTHIGNYHEDNGATGKDLSVGVSRTIRADMIVNGGSLVNMSRAFPSFCLTAFGNTHNGTVPIEFAYYLPGLMTAYIYSNYHSARVGSFLKLVGFYGDTSYSRPQKLVLGWNEGFAKLCRIEYSSLSGGTFTIGQYVGRQSAGVFVALGLILADNGSNLMYVMSQDKAESDDRFFRGNSLVSATLSGSTFTPGSVTATAGDVSYRPKSIWIDGGIIENKRQMVAAFREEGIEKCNFWTTPLDLSVYDSATAGSPLSIAITGSNAGADTIQMDTSELQDGDRVQINITASAFGVADLATYFVSVEDAANIKIYNTEADALAGTNAVDITGDIGAGTILPWNGTLTRETDGFMGYPVFKLARKLMNQENSGRVRYSIDLDNRAYERLRGRLVYIGCWVKQSSASMAVRFTANSLTSRAFGDYSSIQDWKWEEWYAEMPYSGTVNFLINFLAPGSGDTTNYELLLTQPILSLVGIPYTDYPPPVLTAPSGSVTLVAGVGVVANTLISYTTRIRYWVARPGGTQGFLSCANTAGVGFTITSTSATDTSVVQWEIVAY